LSFANKSNCIVIEDSTKSDCIKSSRDLLHRL
jgi:hypothetical protein